MKITILLYENMTALDAIGPYEVLSRLPGVEVLFVGLERGLVTTDTLRYRLTRKGDQLNHPHGQGSSGLIAGNGQTILSSEG